MEVVQTPQAPLPSFPQPNLDASTNEEDDPYYTKLGEFYTEWITLKEENEKAKEDEDNRPFRFVYAFEPV